MSLVLTVSCDGNWNGMPCRGALSAHHTVPLMDELRAKAAHEGWALTVDGDYCPAHARKLAGQDARAVVRELADELGFTLGEGLR